MSTNTGLCGVAEEQATKRGWLRLLNWLLALLCEAHAQMNSRSQSYSFICTLGDWPHEQLEALARGEVERLVGEIDAANEAVKLAQDELLAAQVTLHHEMNRRTAVEPSPRPQ